MFQKLTPEQSKDFLTGCYTLVFNVGYYILRDHCGTCLKLISLCNTDKLCHGVTARRLVSQIYSIEELEKYLERAAQE